MTYDMLVNDLKSWLASQNVFSEAWQTKTWRYIYKCKMSIALLLYLHLFVLLLLLSYKMKQCHSKYCPECRPDENIKKHA